MKIVVLICVCMTRSILIDANKVVFISCYNLFYVLIISLCVSMYSKMHYPYGGPQLSRQNQKPHGKNKIPHGKTKNLTAKTKYLTAKTKTSRQNQKPHCKTKDLTAKPNTSQQKPNTSRQKQIPTAKPKLFCFCCEVFGFAVRYLVLAYQRKVETML